MSNKRLERRRYDKMIFGVASGVAAHFNLDPVIIRLLFVLLTLAGGPGILIYVVMALLMPEEPEVTAKAHVLDDEEIIIKDAA